MFDDHGAAQAPDPGAAAVPADPWPAPGAVAPAPSGPLTVAPSGTAAADIPGIAQAVRDVVVAVQGLRARAREAVTSQERAAWLKGLRQLADGAEVAFTEVLAAFDAHGDGQQLAAAPSTSSWCRRELRMAPGDASGRVRLARLAAAEPQLAAALEQVAEGELRYEQARQISRSVRCLDTPVPDEADRARRGEAIELLVALAATEDPTTIAAAGRRIAEVVHPDGALSARERQLSRRYLQLSPLLDGMTALEGVLDGEGAATVSAALAPLLVPTGPDDDRSTAQRRADALVDVAALALRTQELPQLSGAPAAIDVVVTAETLVRYAALRSDSGDPQAPHRPAVAQPDATSVPAERDRRCPTPVTPVRGGRTEPVPDKEPRELRAGVLDGGTGDGPGGVPGDGPGALNTAGHARQHGEVPGEGRGALNPASTARRHDERVRSWLAPPWLGLIGPNAGGVVPGAPGGPAMLPTEVVARWLCDARVGRWVLGPDSVPLDLGRRQRLFTVEQRRALLLRDAGCRFPGCDRPPRYTDAHHVVPWTAGGATDLDNALLLCRFHHNRLHAAPERGGWLLGIVDTGRGSNGVLTFTGPHGVVLSSAPRGP